MRPFPGKSVAAAGTGPPLWKLLSCGMQKINPPIPPDHVRLKQPVWSFTSSAIQWTFPDKSLEAAMAANTSAPPALASSRRMHCARAQYTNRVFVQALVRAVSFPSNFNRSRFHCPAATFPAVDDDTLCHRTRGPRARSQQPKLPSQLTCQRHVLRRTALEKHNPPACRRGHRAPKKKRSQKIPRSHHRNVERSGP